MSNDMPERPAAGKRRVPRPAPDVNVDPIDPAPVNTNIRPAVEAPVAPNQKPVRVPFSNRLSEDTLDTLARVKLELKLPIYEAIEQAVAEKWSEFSRKK